MKKTAGLALRVSWVFFLALSLFSTNVMAAEHGGGGGEGGASNYQKLEPFTVNLVGLKQYLQVVITLKLAKPEAGEKVKLYMPAVRNDLIYLLSGKTAAEIQSVEGKQRLLAETKATVNKAVNLDAKEGVSEVLFESIIIQ